MSRFDVHLHKGRGLFFSGSKRASLDQKKKKKKKQPTPLAKSISAWTAHRADLFHFKFMSNGEE